MMYFSDDSLGQGGSSPRKKSMQSSGSYDSSPSDVSQLRVGLDRELRNYWVGPMPPREFLDEFLPLPAETSVPPDIGRVFKGIPQYKKESDLAKDLNERVNDASVDLLPGFGMHVTGDFSDKNSRLDRKIRPDMSIYPSNNMPAGEVGKTTRFDGAAAASINEVKAKPYDILSDGAESKGKSTESGAEPPEPDFDSDSDEAEAIPPATTPGFASNDSSRADAKTSQFERMGKQARLIRGQLASYAIELMSRQHLQHVFVVYIFYPYARLIRADRAGLIVSRRFNFTTEDDSQLLAEFYWRFSRCAEATRGRDETVRVLDAENEDDAKLIALAKEKLSPYTTDQRDRPMVEFSIPDGDNVRQFIAWVSMSDADSLVGRATRTFPVYEDDTKSGYMLKDSWRASSLKSEADILRKLSDSGKDDPERAVPHIPTVLCGGDVEGHYTRTHEFASDGVGCTNDPDRKDILRKDWKIGSHSDHIIKRIHHRFVEKEIGKHLDQFENTKQMVRAITDAVIAHQAAYKFCGFLHRDISGRNILILPDGRGLLNDWDLAKDIHDEGTRYHQLTGTWQFMSSQILRNPSKAHDLQDDLESFVLVAIYHIIRYTPHSHTKDVRDIMDAVFNEYRVLYNGTVTGGYGKYAMFTNGDSIPISFRVVNNRPLTQWLKSLMAAVQQWLEYVKYAERQRRAAEDEQDDDLDVLDDALDREELAKISSVQPAATLSLTADALLLADHSHVVQMSELILRSNGWPDGKDRTDDLYPQSQRRNRSSNASASKKAKKVAESSTSSTRASSKRSGEPASAGKSKRMKKAKGAEE